MTRPHQPPPHVPWTTAFVPWHRHYPGQWAMVFFCLNRRPTKRASTLGTTAWQSWTQKTDKQWRAALFRQYQHPIGWAGTTGDRHRVARCIGQTRLGRSCTTTMHSILLGMDRVANPMIAMDPTAKNASSWAPTVLGLILPANPKFLKKPTQQDKTK